MRNIMMRLIFALLMLCLSFSACSDATGPEFWSAKRFYPNDDWNTSWYGSLYKQIRFCVGSGVEIPPFADLEWYSVPEDGWYSKVEGQRVMIEWVKPNRIYVAEAYVEGYPHEIMHTMLHYALQTREHPRRYFGYCAPSRHPKPVQ